MERLVLDVVPSLSRSLDEQFNLFRVMHHGKHEKQLSNVFAWLLDPQGTHQLGAVPQRLFLELVNQLSGNNLPIDGYRVTQEINVAPATAPKKDIADIVLMRRDAGIVIENYGTSDGHEHKYGWYLDLAKSGGREGIVIMLCELYTPHRLDAEWRQSTVITYAAFLRKIEAYLVGKPSWRANHPDQYFFIRQTIQNFVEGPTTLNTDERLSFLAMMCETGESKRYGQQPHGSAADQFAAQIAQHARHQFEETRELLGQIKSALRGFALASVKDQVNQALGEKRINQVSANFTGRWEWYVTLRDSEGKRVAGIIFGPTAVEYQSIVTDPLAEPDYTKLFVLIKDSSDSDIGGLFQTEVTLEEVLNGLGDDDMRLRDAVLAALATSRH